MRRNAALSIDYLDHMPAYNEETAPVSENDDVRNLQVHNLTREEHQHNASAHVLHALSARDTTIQPSRSPARELIDRLRQELIQNRDNSLLESPLKSADQVTDASVTEEKKASLTAWQRLEQDLKAKGNKKLNKAVKGWIERLHDERKKNQELLNIGECQEAIQAATTAVDTAEKNAVDHEKRLQSLTENLQRLVDFLDSGDRVIVNSEQNQTPYSQGPVSHPVHPELIAQQLEQTLREEFLLQNKPEHYLEEEPLQKEAPVLKRPDPHKMMDASEAMSLMFHGATPVAQNMQVQKNTVTPPLQPQPVLDNPFAAFYGASPSSSVQQTERVQMAHVRPAPSAARSTLPPSQKMAHVHTSPAAENHRKKEEYPSQQMRGVSPHTSGKVNHLQPPMREKQEPGHAVKSDVKIRPPSENKGNRRPRMQHAPLPEEQPSVTELSVQIPLENTFSQEINFNDFSIEPDFFSNEKQINQASIQSAIHPQVRVPKSNAEGGSKKVYIYGTLGFLLIAILTAGGIAFGLPNLSDQAPVNTASVSQDKVSSVAVPPLQDVAKQPDTLPQNAEEETAPVNNQDVQITSTQSTSSGAISKPRIIIAEIGSLGELPVVSSNPTLRDAALNGDAYAVYELAHRLEAGQGVVRDVGLSAKLFLRAAEQGFVPAQTRVAHQFEKGIGLERDPALAREWYRRAAEAGNVKAMHQLAMIFAQGVGGPTDYASAALWFKRAAKFGYKDSQFNFAILASKGLGMKPSLVQAYTHFAAASQQGDKDAERKRDEVGSRLGAEDLAFARKSAEQWQNQTPDPAANSVPEIVL